MEKELNIAVILKDKPKDTSLYSPIFGLCRLYEVNMKWEEFPISVIYKSQIKHLKKDGRFYFEGECMLFPSKEMQDWSKFAWKKGDVLTTKTKSLTVVFDHFNATYESFVAKYSFCSYQEKNEDDAWNKEGENSYKTLCFSKVSGNEAKEYIKKVEEHYGGKLNLETLQIEQPKKEFKDGDIVVAEGNDKDKKIFIFRYKIRDSNNNERGYKSYITINSDKSLLNNMYFYLREDIVYRLATDSEKQQLLSKLEEIGKKWNPDTKQIEDLPKKCEFKPLDWCLMRDHREKWKLCQFGFFDKGDEYEAPYNAVGGNWYNECIPYNDQTKHLLGTTDEWEEGDG